MALQLCPDCGVETGRGSRPALRCQACEKRLLQAPLFHDWDLHDHSRVAPLDELLALVISKLATARDLTRQWDERAAHMREIGEPLDNSHHKRAGVDRAMCAHLERQRCRITDAIAKRGADRRRVPR